MTEQERFSRCLEAVLRFEGGFVDDPRDPGGATRFGVTRAVLGEALGRPATVADVQAMTQDAAAAIYRQRYWSAVRGEALPAGVDLCAFDAGVNMGPVASVRLLQGALGIDADGLIGPNTLAALARQRTANVIHLACELRRNRYRNLAGFPVYGKGWQRRVDAVEALAMSWADDPPPALAASAAA